MFVRLCQCYVWILFHVSNQQSSVWFILISSTCFCFPLSPPIANDVDEFLLLLLFSCAVLPPFIDLRVLTETKLSSIPKTASW